MPLSDYERKLAKYLAKHPKAARQILGYARKHPTATLKPAKQPIKEQLIFARVEPAAQGPRPGEIFHDAVITKKRYVSPEERQRRSEAAKKAWQVIHERDYVYDFHNKKWVKKPKEGTGGIKPVKVMNRSSCAINGIPMHGEYASAILQAFDWDADYLADLKQKLIDKLIDCVEKYLGYDESDWWFSYEINYEYPHEIGAFDQKLDNTWRFYVEKDGKVVSSRMGMLNYL